MSPSFARFSSRRPPLARRRTATASRWAGAEVKLRAGSSPQFRTMRISSTSPAARRFRPRLPSGSPPRAADRRYLRRAPRPRGAGGPAASRRPAAPTAAGVASHRRQMFADGAASVRYGLASQGPGTPYVGLRAFPVRWQELRRFGGGNSGAGSGGRKRRRRCSRQGRAGGCRVEVGDVVVWAVWHRNVAPGTRRAASCTLPRLLPKDRSTALVVVGLTASRRREHVISWAEMSQTARRVPPARASYVCIGPRHP